MAEETLESLAASLQRAGGEAIMRRVEAVVKRAAVNVKRDWRENAKATAGDYASAYPFSITFDPVTRTRTTVSTLVGPDKAKRQGALGNLLEYGSVNNPPHNDGKRAADKEEPQFAKQLGDAAVEVLRPDMFGGAR